MKKFFQLFIIPLIITTILWMNLMVKNLVHDCYYAQEFIVSDINIDSDLVTIKTSTGVIYQFFGIEDWEINDHCACLMFNNFTSKDIMDDKIINIRYCGF